MVSESGSMPAGTRRNALLDPTRWIAAALGFGLATATLAAGYALSSIPLVERVLSFRFLFEPGGLVAMTPTDQAVAWSAGPIAAGVTGWFVGRRAAGGDRWAGLWMGAGTYVLAITIGAIGFEWWSLPSGDVVSALAAVPFAALIASVLLAPIVVVCAIAGSIWAAAIRRWFGQPAVVVPARWPVSFLIAVIALLLIAWAAGASIFALSDFGDVPTDAFD